MDQGSDIVIKEIRLKVNALLSERKSLFGQIKELEEKIHSLQLALDTQKNTIQSLKEQNKISKLAETLTGRNESSKEMTIVVNRYIREIDECIRLIGDSKL